MFVTDSPALAREALVRLAALAHLAETTTNPLRMERLIRASYLRWRRRATTALLLSASRYESLTHRSLQELKLAMAATDPATKGRFFVRAQAIEDPARRIYALDVLNRARWEMRREIERREQAQRSSGPAAGVEPIAPPKRRATGEKRGAGASVRFSFSTRHN